MGTLSMSVSEREAFLAQAHVGVLAIERAEGPPLAVPVWYGYEPGGDVWVLTEASSVKGRLLRAAGRASLCAQNETPPLYAYVSVEGPLTFGEPDLERHRRTLARRYLGPELGDGYVEASPAAPDLLLVSLRPERWFTVDYAKLGSAGD